MSSFDSIISLMLKPMTIHADVVRYYVFDLSI